MKTLSIPQLFQAVQEIIFNLLENKDLQSTIGGYGMTLKRIQEGNTLLQNARQMYKSQENHYDVARKLKIQLAQDNETALEIFKDHVAIAKAAFRKERHVIEELKIKRMSGKKWAWTQQAIDFYDKASAYMEKLQQFGATEISFQQNKAAAEAIQNSRARRLKKKGDAENSTQERNESIKELRAWYGEFRKLARIAFKKNPQILETFGIVVLSGPRKRKGTEEVPENAEEETSSAPPAP